jgi:flagellar basal-body rod modification protein FlgD
MNITSTPSNAELLTSLNGKSAAVTKNDEASADRFLKLLVAQLQNQDPLNPLDNAQVTTQMAQINTVEGINKLNVTVGDLKDTFIQLQSMQGAALLGKEVTLNGDKLSVSGEGSAAVGDGAYELAVPADEVRLEVLSPSGRVIASQQLGAKAAGQYDFSWPGGAMADQDGLRFRVVASQSGTAVAAQPIMFGRVLGVSAGGDALKLTLDNASGVNYADVRSVRQAD